MDRDFQTVLADIPAVVFRGYADGSIDLFDGKVEAMTGYTREEFETRQRKWTDLILEADRGLVKRAFVDALKAGKAYTREYRISARAGNQIWVHERSHIVCDPEGGIEYVNGLFFDITERKNLEQSLHKAEQDFRIIVDNIPAVTFKGYVDGTVDLFDKKVEALIGYSQESFGPHGMKWTDVIWEEDRQSARRAFIQALRTNRTDARTSRPACAAGTWRTTAPPMCACQ